MTTTSKTAAIREARGHVSIHGSGTSWTVIYPYDGLAGASTEQQASSYAQAQAIATRVRAAIALQLMGHTDDALIDEAVHGAYDGCFGDASLPNVLGAALQILSRAK